MPLFLLCSLSPGQWALIKLRHKLIMVSKPVVNFLCLLDNVKIQFESWFPQWNCRTFALLCRCYFLRNCCAWLFCLRLCSSYIWGLQFRKIQWRDGNLHLPCPANALIKALVSVVRWFTPLKVSSIVMLDWRVEFMAHQVLKILLKGWVTLKLRIHCLVILHSYRAFKLRL